MRSPLAVTHNECYRAALSGRLGAGRASVGDEYLRLLIVALSASQYPISRDGAQTS